MTISPKCRKLAVRCLLALLAVLMLLSGTVALAEDSYGMSTSSFNVTVQADRDHTSPPGITGSCGISPWIGIFMRSAIFGWRITPWI